MWLGQAKYKVGLEHLVPESKEVLKNDGDLGKDTKLSLKKLSQPNPRIVLATK